MGVGVYDVIIIGGGPAGVGAAVYAARKKLKAVFITASFGGQSIVSSGIQNWIGETHISGYDLAKKLEAHARSYANIIEIKSPEWAASIKAMDCVNGREACNFEVTSDKSVYIGRSLIITTGARRKKLGVPGEEEFNGKGVAYCSTCDAPIFDGKAVAVVGGGNAGFEAVVDLLPYASKIYLLHHNEILKGDPVTQEEVKNNSSVQILLNVEIIKIVGDKFVSGIKYKDLKTAEIKDLAVEGVFVEVGSVPNSEIVKDFVKLDQWGQIVIDAKHSSTSHPGIFAAGDVTDDPYKQNNISAGDGVRAALAAYAYLQKRVKHPPSAA